MSIFFYPVVSWRRRRFVSHIIRVVDSYKDGRRENLCRTLSVTVLEGAEIPCAASLICGGGIKITREETILLVSTRHVFAATRSRTTTARGVAAAGAAAGLGPGASCHGNPRRLAATAAPASSDASASTGCGRSRACAARALRSSPLKKFKYSIT